MKKIKIISVFLVLIIICGCASKETNSIYKPYINVFNKSLNNKYEIENESFMINKNGDRLEYVKNDTGQIILIKKISAKYQQKECQEIAKKDMMSLYYITKIGSSRFFKKFEQDEVEYTKTQYFKIEYVYCKKNIDEKYNYEITVGNTDIMPNVIEKTKKIKKNKSYSEETFGPVGQYIAIPVIVVGAIILSPFYIIQMISK